MDNSTNTILDNPNNTYVDNSSLYISPLRGPGFVVFNVVMLLAVVLPVIVANTVILVALVLESSTAKVVRLVLGSILVSCLLAALGLAMCHISGIILNISLVNNPPRVSCTIIVFLMGFGGTARRVFMATFAVIVYIIKSGKDSKKHTFVAVLTAVVTLWVLAFLGVSPLFSQDIVYTKYVDSSCDPQPIKVYSYIFIGLYLLFFGLVPLSVTIVLLVITSCFIKYHSFTDIQAKTAMVKFGFFLLLGHGTNLLGQLVAVIAIFINPTSGSDREMIPTDAIGWIYTVYTLLNVSLIPTPILIPIYFKPIRKRLQHWLCCCMLKKRMVKLMNNRNTVEGSRSVRGTEMAMTEI